MAGSGAGSVPLTPRGFLAGKGALVTGAGRGIGRSIARSLAAEGARVVLAARTRAEVEAAAAEITAGGGDALAAPADISRPEEVRRLYAAARERLGRLDIAVNNAGIGLYGKLADFPLDDFDRVLATNLRGTFLSCQEAMRLMVPQGGGTIINIASVVGFKGYPNQSAYTASKHGIMGLTKALAVEAQPHGIRVSAVLPGGVDTALATSARPDLKREELLRPEDIARTVLFLLSLPEHAAIDEIYIRRRTSAPF
jgi:NAD(P)-dependent dehydrogenase (short-subunit alcohol dehydrogenase family)